jgi:Domain of unknown function (DUF5667)
LYRYGKPYWQEKTVSSNKEFDNIFNECMERLLAGGETVGQCLQRYPAYAKELEPLLRTVVLMHKVADVKPSEEFRARARYQMQLKMAQSATPRRITRHVPRWAIAACTAMLVFVLGGGSVLAAQNVMPGNILYAVKLTTEDLQLKLAGSTESKTEQYIAMANERITEMDWMVNNNKIQNLQAAASRLNNYYTGIGELAMAGGSKTTFSAAIAGPTTVTPGVSTAIATTASQNAIVPATTPPAAGATYSALATTIVITAPAATNIVTTGNSSNSNHSTPLLGVLNSNAAVQPSEIQQLLNSNKVPDSVKATLQRALIQSNIVYQSAINNANHQ